MLLKSTHVSGQDVKSSSLRLAVQSTLGVAMVSLPLLTFAADLPPVSVGAGMRTSFTHSEVDGSPLETDDFNLDSARIYVSGKATDTIGFMFNTEYNGANETIGVIDAVAQFSFSDQFNIWAGRFLPPSDRANMYGPYYANHWGVYTDGVQDGYPFETTGRDDGVMYWGQFGIAKVSAGVFDVQGLTKGSSDVLAATRLQLDFWDQEGGYYLNGTYYGEKDLLAVGVAAQNSAGENAYSLDFLLEKKLGSSGTISFEAEYAKYDGLGGYIGGTKSDGWYLLAGYLFPAQVGIGKFQVVAKVGQTTYEDNVPPISPIETDHDTREFNFNYIIKSFNARLGAFYLETDYSPGTKTKKYGVALQVQM
jgi:hypothetical protein